MRGRWDSASLYEGESSSGIHTRTDSTIYDRCFRGIFWYPLGATLSLLRIVADSLRQYDTILGRFPKLGSAITGQQKAPLTHTYKGYWTKIDAMPSGLTPSGLTPSLTPSGLIYVAQHYGFAGLRASSYEQVVALAVSCRGVTAWLGSTDAGQEELVA
jgi:hypothetical protein